MTTMETCNRTEPEPYVYGTRTEQEPTISASFPSLLRIFVTTVVVHVNTFFLRLFHFLAKAFSVFFLLLKFRRLFMNKNTLTLVTITLVIGICMTTTTTERERERERERENSLSQKMKFIIRQLHTIQHFPGQPG